MLAPHLVGTLQRLRLQVAGRSRDRPTSTLAMLMRDREAEQNVLSDVPRMQGLPLPANHGSLAFTAMRVQCKWRALVARRRLERLRATEAEDSHRRVRHTIAVQATWRKARALGHLSTVKAAASVLLSAARGQAVRRALGAYNAAATVIEAYARRRAAVALLHLARHAATRLQSAWRRSSALANLNRAKAAVERLHTWMRSHVARLAAAAIIVQTIRRAYVARLFLRTAKASAVRLQAATRRDRALRSFRSIVGATVRVQVRARVLLAKRERRRRARGLVRLQAIGRMWIARRTLRRTRHWTVKIQKRVKAKFARAVMRKLASSKMQAALAESPLTAPASLCVAELDALLSQVRVRKERAVKAAQWAAQPLLVN